MSLLPNFTLHLRAEVSIPSLLFGNNVTLPNMSQVETGLSELSRYVSDKAELNFDAFTARVNRVDYAHDFYVGENEIVPRISAISNLSLPRFNRSAFNDTSVYFKNKGKHLNRSIRFYGKHAEVIQKKNSSTQELEASRGKLRLEYSFMALRSVQRLASRIHLSPKASELLQKDVSDKILTEILRDLKLTQNTIANDTRFETLLDFYGSQRTKSLWGFLGFLDKFGENFYQIKLLKYSRTTYFRDAAACRSAGVWHKPQYGNVLPPLILN